MEYWLGCLLWLESSEKRMEKSQRDKQFEIVKEKAGIMSWIWIGMEESQIRSKILRKCSEKRSVWDSVETLFIAVMSWLPIRKKFT